MCAAQISGEDALSCLVVHHEDAGLVHAHAHAQGRKIGDVLRPISAQGRRKEADDAAFGGIGPGLPVVEAAASSPDCIGP